MAASPLFRLLRSWRVRVFCLCLTLLACGANAWGATIPWRSARVQFVAQKKDLEAPVRCWNCRAFNSIGAKLCEQCNFALDFSNVAALMADLKKLGPIIKHLSEMQAATDERLMEAHRIERFRGRLRRKL